MVSVPGIDTSRDRTTARPGRKRGLGRAKAATALAVASLLFATACGAGGDEKKKNGLAAGDYTVVREDDVTNSIVVNGNISPARTMNLTTPLQTEVENVAVAAGDRVAVDQFLLDMNSTAAEAQLAQQQQQQANAQADAVQAAEAAQAQLNAVRDQINRGTYPAIAQAQSAVNQAQAAYDAAVAGQGAVAMDASVNQIKRFIGDISSGGAPHPAPQPVPVPVPVPVPSPEQQQLIQQRIVEQEQAAQAQQQVATQLSVAQAEAALREAYAQLDVARTQAAQERDQLKRQAESAWRQAEMASNATGDGALEYQVQSATVYAPMGGLVTSVDVKEGDVPQGKLLTIVDDSRLLIRTQVREVDMPNIKTGNRVTFTSTATGPKEFAGRVSWISPVGAPGEGDQQANASVMFPVDIEVTGDKEGLLLGGSTRAEIITEQTPDSLSVPLDAVYDDAGTNKVLVLSTDEGDKRGTVEERTVETGAANEVDVAVTGGDLKQGDIVINWPDQYRDKLGDTVAVADPNFNPDEVAQARASSAPAPTTSAQNKG